MGVAVEEGIGLGALARFPTVLHARGSLIFDMNLETLQRTIIQALLELQKKGRSMEVSVADHEGYSGGVAHFRVGVGNALEFDRLEARMGEALLRRIEERGPVQTFDMAIHIGYTLRDGGRHNLRRDSYLVRLQFRLGGAELLLHHLKGLRRIHPDELVRLFISQVNMELAKEHYSELELETFTST